MRFFYRMSSHASVSGVWWQPPLVLACTRACAYLVSVPGVSCLGCSRVHPVVQFNYFIRLPRFLAGLVWPGWYGRASVAWLGLGGWAGVALCGRGLCGWAGVSKPSWLGWPGCAGAAGPPPYWYSRAGTGAATVTHPSHWVISEFDNKSRKFLIVTHDFLLQYSYRKIVISKGFC